MDPLRIRAKNKLKRVACFALYFTGLVFPKNKRIWVFGSRQGKYYNDNSRYFFEYVAKQVHDVRAIWITRSAEVYREVSKRGFEVYFAYSPRGLYYALRAGVAFVCVVKDDIFDFAIGGAMTVHLWHAIQIKDPFIPYNFVSQGAGFFERLTKRIQDEVQVAIAASESQVPIMARTLGIDAQRVVTTGYPKTDHLFRKNITWNLNEIDVGVKIPPHSKMILYLPTFRGGKFDQSTDLFLKFGFDFNRMSELLKEHDAVLLCIPHYRIQIQDREFLKRWDESPRMRMARKTGVSFDPNLLHPFVDVLITDYSSVFVNFLAMDRPMIFAPFDYDEYVKNSGGIAYNYEAVTPGPKVHNWNEVCEQLNEMLSGDDHWGDARKKVRATFFAHEDGESSRRVTEAVRQKAGV